MVGTDVTSVTFAGAKRAFHNHERPERYEAASASGRLGMTIEFLDAHLPV